MTLNETYQKLRDGDPISDEELNFMIKTLKPIEKGLRELGERFYFTWRQIADDVRRLEDYKQARKEK